MTNSASSSPRVHPFILSDRVDRDVVTLISRRAMLLFERYRSSSRASSVSTSGGRGWAPAGAHTATVASSVT